MKRLFILFFAFALSCSLYSQTVVHDTIYVVSDNCVEETYQSKSNNEFIYFVSGIACVRLFDYAYHRYYYRPIPYFNYHTYHNHYRHVGHGFYHPSYIEGHHRNFSTPHHSRPASRPQHRPSGRPSSNSGRSNHHGRR